MKKINLKITGMHCKSCETLIGDAVKELAGVYTVRVDHKSGVAEIAFDETKVKESDIISVISKEGYKVGK